MNKVRGLALLLLATMLVASPVLAQTAQPTQSATEASLEYTLNIGTSKDFPKIIVGPNGMTLYTFTVDPLGQSACNDKCATFWPPLTVASADKVTADSEIYGKVGTLTRKDGTIQVTYNGMGLYYWSKDKAVGDTTGNRVTRNWWVVPPSVASIYHDPKLGSILVGQNGMTVYKFAKDAPGVSNCTGQCATAWPPETVGGTDDLIAGANLNGKWDTIKRDDGKLQVTYNGWPLYYFSKDKAIGDTMGEGVGNSWSTIPPETVVKSNTSALGDFLVTYDGMTVYTFSKDTPNTSTCTGDCAKNWPAFTADEVDRLVGGTGVTGKLATIEGADKTYQVTYNGMPLYLFKNDVKPGDTMGNGVGGVWSVVKP